MEEKVFWRLTDFVGDSSGFISLHDLKSVSCVNARHWGGHVVDFVLASESKDLMEDLRGCYAAMVEKIEGYKECCEYLVCPCVTDIVEFDIEFEKVYAIGVSDCLFIEEYPNCKNFCNMTLRLVYEEALSGMALADILMGAGKALTRQLYAIGSILREGVS